MRAVIGVLGLVVVLGMVGWLTKTQVASTRQAIPSLVPPGTDPVTPTGTVSGQAQHIQQQVRQSLEAAMQQAQPMPDEK